MTLPVVAIVGRPNVGKSALFNRLIGRRLAIVEETPGLTRDRLYAECEWSGHRFVLVDTGGLVSDGREGLLAEVREQTRRAIAEADVLLCVVDGQRGPLPEDAEVAGLLRQVKKSVLLVANKVDDPGHEAGIYEFHALGLGDPIPVSAHHGLGIGDLLDEVVARLPRHEPEPAEAAGVRVAVVGRPNVGKSSLVNAILGEARVIVAEAPGTTRDAVDTPLRFGERPFVLIDTAGLRRRSRVEEPVERYSVLRARRALERADAAVLVLDATEGVTDQDQRIAREIVDAGRAIVVALNKWDLIPADRGAQQDVEERSRYALRFVGFAPLVPISAKTGRGIDALMAAVLRVADAYGYRVGTGPLNRVIEAAEQRTPPPADSAGRRAKILYATQAAVRPPAIVLFVNNPDLVPANYLRYLEGALREEFPFVGVPLRLLVRERTRVKRARGEGGRGEPDDSGLPVSQT